jgi:hypothetical protein
VQLNLSPSEKFKRVLYQKERLFTMNMGEGWSGVLEKIHDRPLAVVTIATA